MVAGKVMVGASFTAVTVIVKVCTADSSIPGVVPPLSVNFTLIVALPFAFAAGV